MKKNNGFKKPLKILKRKKKMMEKCPKLNNEYKILSKSFFKRDIFMQK